MGIVLFGMTISLDGYVNDRNGDVGRLYPDLAAIGKTEILQEQIRTTGAVVMGRHAYDMAGGDFTGYEFQVPIFVLTHRVPKTAPKGENDKFKFTFITDGIESAIRQAKAAAGDKDVTVIGGPNIGQQLLDAGLIDVIEVGIVPVLLGEGLRLFGRPGRQYELVKTVSLESLGVTYLRYQVVKEASVV